MLLTCFKKIFYGTCLKISKQTIEELNGVQKMFTSITTALNIIFEGQDENFHNEVINYYTYKIFITNIVNICNGFI